MEEFSSYFKYCSDDKNVINGIFKNHKIRFTQPWGMNDPLEFNPTLVFPDQENSYQSFELDGIILPSIQVFYRILGIESQINAYGILSLTKLPFSFDMWSQYANGHKGFVLEFKPKFIKDDCMKSKDGEENILRKVEYVDEYVLNIGELMGEKGEIPFEVLQNEFFFKKTSRWKDEQEYRLVRPLTDYPGYKPISKYSHRDENRYLFEFSLECISSVIFGANMSIENKKVIFDNCKDYKINFYQSYIVRDERDNQGKPSNVRFVSIKKFKSIDELLKLQPYIFVVDIKQGIGRRSKKINKISDLSYYEDYKEIVDKVFEDLKKNNP